MRKILLLAALALIGATAATAATSPKPTCAIDENGNCLGGDPSYDPYYAYTEAGEDSVDYYGSPNLGCKTVHAIRTVRNIYWVILFQYVEQVYFCWFGGTVTTFTRWRWPQNITWGMWAWDGNTDAGNCTSEYCTEQTGGYSEHAKTTGQLHPNWCPFSFCGHRYPWVDIAVTGDGQWGANTGG